MIRSRQLKLATSSRSRSTTGRRSPMFEQLEIRNLLAVLVVDNVNDSGLGSLRNAIELANAQAGADSIEFAIPGSGLHTIKPQSPLPPILETLTIDGYSQSGSAPNTLLNGQNNAVITIEIDGTDAGTDAVGLGIYGAPASNSVIRGLAINSFDASSIFGGRAIDIQLGAENLVVEGNFLGTDATGSTAKPNAYGVYMANVAAGRIGTDGDGSNDAAERNLVSGNSRVGIALVTNIYVDNLNRITVAGNSVGVDRLGQTAIANGIGIQNGFSQANTLIGTDGGSQHLAQRNLVSGNLQNGIDTGGSINVTIAGNFVGTDFSGTAPLGNLWGGIVIPFGSSGNVIGTNGDGVGDQYEGNLVSGNLGDQVLVQGDAANNIIAGNIIGLDVSGTFAISAPSGNAGVYLQNAGSGNIVGTNSDGVSDELERNVIASAGYSAVRIDAGAGGNRISGNYLNTAADGLQAIPVSDGVRVINSPDNIIGTNGDGVRDAEEANVIGGSIDIIAAASVHNIVAGNRMGVGADGATPLGGGIRVLEGASENRIGTNGDGVSDVLERNIVNYIHLWNSSGTASSNQVSGNYVGVAADGTTLIGRSEIIVWQSHNNLIGTNADGQNDAVEANVVGGSQEWWGAIQLVHSNGNTIAGNFVGVGADGVTPIPNAYGIGVIGSGVNLLGGAHPNAGNRIANSVHQGIVVQNGRLTMLGNAVYSNGPNGSPLPTGIDLGWDQLIQANDSLDSDVGANDLQNYPDVSNVLVTGVQSTISGVLHSAPNQTYRVELFGNSQLDASGYGEGERFLGFVQVNTDAAGNGSFSVVLPGLAVGDWVTSTATDANGNTSEFSLGIEAVQGNQPPNVSLIGPASGVRGQPRSFVFSATDDINDEAAGFSYAINWGDGSPVQFVLPLPGNGSGVTLAHRFATTGSYSVTVTATDQAGQASNVVTTHINIVPVAIQPDPLYPGTTMLVVGGTPSADEIEIEWNNQNAQFKVAINDHELGNYVASGRILVYAQAGDDTVVVAGNITRSAWLYGGEGNDHLKGGKGNDVLLGEEGDDLLVGGSGHDLLIAGYGEDRVVGNADDDILISGFTDFDSNDNALKAILSEWTSGNAYATRVNHLTGQAGGLNGTIYLTVDGPTATVHDDNAKDTLTGSAGNDWFFANLFLDSGDDATKKDKITDLHANEFASDLDFILS